MKTLPGIIPNLFFLNIRSNKQTAVFFKHVPNMRAVHWMFQQLSTLTITTQQNNANDWFLRSSGSSVEISESRY